MYGALENGRRMSANPRAQGTSSQAEANVRTLDLFQKEQEIQISMWNLQTFKSWQPMLKLTYVSFWEL